MIIVINACSYQEAISTITVALSLLYIEEKTENAASHSATPNHCVLLFLCEFLGKPYSSRGCH